jgi:hypothetical protein
MRSRKIFRPSLSNYESIPMLTPRIRRMFLFSHVAVASLGLTAVQPVMATDCGCGSAAVAGPSGGCDCAEVKRHPKLHQLPYKALESVAFGIEKVLGLDKVHCGCQTAHCDDGCDAAALQEFSGPMFELQGSAQAPDPHDPHPAAQIHPSPATLKREQPWQDDSQWQPGTTPRMQMRMGEPQFVDPQILDRPGSESSPQNLAPPVHPAAQPADPFLDDVRKTNKRRVQPTHYQPATNGRGRR